MKSHIPRDAWPLGPTRLNVFVGFRVPTENKKWRGGFLANQSMRPKPAELRYVFWLAFTRKPTGTSILGVKEMTPCLTFRLFKGNTLFDFKVKSGVPQLPGKKRTSSSSKPWVAPQVSPLRSAFESGSKGLKLEPAQIGAGRLEPDGVQVAIAWRTSWASSSVLHIFFGRRRAQKWAGFVPFKSQPLKGN